MNHFEFDNCIFQIGTYYPDFALHGAWSRKWFDTLKFYSKAEVLEALEQWVTSPNKYHGALHPQKIAQFKVFVEEAAKRNRVDEEDPDAVEKLPQVKKFRKTSPIEFCMDVLGVELVTEELKNIVGNPEDVKWHELLSKENAKKVRKKVAEMFETAKQFDPEQYKRRFEKEGVS